MFKKGKLIKFFTKTFVGRITDKVILGGALNSTAKETNTNKGTVDAKEIVLELLTTTLPILFTLSLIFGWLDIETVKQLAKLFLP